MMTAESLVIRKEKTFSMTFIINPFSRPSNQTSQVETHYGMDWYIKSVCDEASWNGGSAFHISLYGDSENLAEKRFRTSVKGEIFFVTPNESSIVAWNPVPLISCPDGCVVTQKIDYGHVTSNNMVDGAVTIRCVVNLYFDHPLFKLNFAIPSEEILSDVVLLVEDQEFKVSKAVLGTFSTYFRTLFFDEYEESKKPLIPLEQIYADEFQELLEVVYHKNDVTLNNARELLELATYFNFASIRGKCEQILLNAPDSTVPLKEKLHLADKYVLPELLEKCMTSFKTIAELKAATPKNVKKLSPTTTEQLLQRVVDIQH